MTQTNVNTGGSTQAAYGRNGSITGAVNIRASHTIAIRVRHTSTATNYDSVCIGYSTNTAGNNSGSFIGRFNADPSTSLAFYRWNGISTFNTASYAGCYGNTTSWYHLCLVYDASGALITPYIDGTAQATISSATTLVTSTTTTRLWAGGPHPGVFCDAVLFGRALTGAEVGQLVNGRDPRVLAHGDLIAYCPEYGDQVTLDLSGNANTLSVINSGTGSTPTASNENPPKSLGTTHFYVVAPPEITRSLAATGSTQTTGTAAQTKSANLVGTGSTQVTGSASSTESASLSATGSTQVTGFADVPSALVTQYNASSPDGQLFTAWALPRSNVASSDVFFTWLLDSSRAFIDTSSYARISLNGTTLHYEVSCPTLGISFSHDEPISIGTWYHVGLKFGSTTRAYLNGVEVANGAVDLSGTGVNTGRYYWQRNGDMTLRDATHWSFPPAYGLPALYAYRSAGLLARTFFEYWPMLTGGNRLNSANDATISGQLLLKGTVPETNENPPATWGPPQPLQAIAQSITYSLVATGTTQTTGAAATTEAALVVASGTTQTTGAGALTSAAGLAATGTTNTTGAAILTSDAGLVATGTTNVTGSANLYNLISAAGTTQVTGTAATDKGFSVASAATVQVTGAAAITSGASLATSGTTQSSGAASLTASIVLPASGTTSVTGAAALTSTVPTSATGSTNVTGAATLTVIFPVVAAGLTMMSGSATVSSSAQPSIRPIAPVSRRFLSVTGRRLTRTR